MAASLPDSTVVEVEAADGVIIRCRRYRREGARAVVCGHGLASTGYEFDLPLAGFSLAEKLYRLGYEVWIMNFSGAGHPPWQSEPRGARHSGDTQGALDLAAVVDRVVEETGQPCFYIGHSFGGMSLYIYLQGTAPSESVSGAFVRDPELARRRNGKVAAALTVGSPASLADDLPPWWEKIRRTSLMQSVMKKIEGFLRRRSRRKPLIPVGRFSRRFGFRHPRLTRMIMSGFLMKPYLRPEMMGREACRLFGTWAGGDVACLHVAQSVRAARTGELASMDREGDGRLNYTDGMGAVTAPLAAAAGTRDLLCPAEGIRRKVLGEVSSDHTLFLPINGCGHCDMLYHLPLEEITGWMEWAAATTT